MNIGQKVMLISMLEFYHEWGDHLVPPIGAIGFISSPLDEYDEYDVIFDGYPHPAIDDPAWVVTKYQIVPVDDMTEYESESEVIECHA